MRFVMDTNAVLYLLGDRLEGPLPCGSYFISVITELELLAYPGISPEEEQNIKAFLQDIEIVNLVEPIKVHAADLRRRLRLRLPDAIIAATALYLDAVLLTNDQRILKVAEIKAQSLNLR